MTRWILLAAAVALVPVNLQAQARPDFSGKWTLATDQPGSWTCTYAKTGQANEAVRPSGVTNVFVGSPEATQQTSKLTAELAASVADLQKALKKQSSLRLVDTPEAAEVILRVQDRQRKTHLAGSVPSGGDFGSAPTYNSWSRLTVEVRGGGRSTPVVAQAKTWKGAASRAVRDVTTWIDANRRVLHR